MPVRTACQICWYVSSHSTPSWASWIQPTVPHLTLPTSILILSFQLSLDLPSCLFFQILQPNAFDHFSLCAPRTVPTCRRNCRTVLRTVRFTRCLKFRYCWGKTGVLQGQCLRLFVISMFVTFLPVPNNHQNREFNVLLYQGQTFSFFATHPQATRLVQTNVYICPSPEARLLSAPPARLISYDWN